MLIEEDISPGRLHSWLQSQQPDVLISHFTHPATVLQWLRESGIRVPQGIGYVALDLPDDSAKISGVFQNYERVAQAAIDLLVVQINNFQRGMPNFPRVISIQGS